MGRENLCGLRVKLTQFAFVYQLLFVWRVIRASSLRTVVDSLHILSTFLHIFRLRPAVPPDGGAFNIIIDRMTLVGGEIECNDSRSHKYIPYMCSSFSRIKNKIMYCSF